MFLGKSLDPVMVMQTIDIYSKIPIARAKLMRKIIFLCLTGNSTCLIPVTRNESNRSILTPSMQYLASYNTSKQKLDPAIANTFPRVKNNTVRRNGSHSERTKKRKVCQSDRCERYDVMKVTNLLISEDASQQTDCMCDNSDDDSASEAEVANNQEGILLSFFMW